MQNSIEDHDLLSLIEDLPMSDRKAQNVPQHAHGTKQQQQKQQQQQQQQSKMKTRTSTTYSQYAICNITGFPLNPTPKIP
jgi:hypothetical protein